MTLENRPESLSSFYHAHIQRLLSDSQRVVVFIEELGQMRELPIDHLRPLPTNQRSFTNRQFKHLKSLRFSPDFFSAPVPLLGVGAGAAGPGTLLPTQLPPGRGGRFHEGRGASRGWGHFDRPILNACGKPRRDRYPQWGLKLYANLFPMSEGLSEVSGASERTSE